MSQPGLHCKTMSHKTKQIKTKKQSNLNLLSVLGDKWVT
jgi:hypothetical protein